MRRAAGMLLLGRARRRVAELDQQAAGACQRRALLGLVHRAQATRFGQHHDFRRIRSVDDFRRLVPLRTPAELWREYWGPAFPHLGGTTWPGPITDLAFPDLPLTGPLPCVPVSPDLWRAHQRAAFTALSFVLDARPTALLLSGCFLPVEGEMLGELQAAATPPESLAAIARRRLPQALHPYLASLPVQHGGNGSPACSSLRSLAEASAGQPVTCVLGTAEQLPRFFTLLKEVTGKDQVRAIWPNLAAVVFSRDPRSPEKRQVQQALGPASGTPVMLLESFFRPEGAIAVEDPRWGCLRLLADHDVYFEFVPEDQLGAAQPARLGADQVQTGVRYALALTSPAGLWACLIGVVVRFERCQPHLLRVVETGQPHAVPPPPAPPPPVPRPKPAHAFPWQPPHVRAPQPLPLPVLRSWA